MILIRCECRFHRWLPGDAFSLKRILENERLSAEYLMKRIDERRRALASGARVEREGVVDAFLAEQSRLERELRDGDEAVAGAAAENESESITNTNANARANETPHLFPGARVPATRDYLSPFTRNPLHSYTRRVEFPCHALER